MVKQVAKHKLLHVVLDKSIIKTILLQVIIRTRHVKTVMLGHTKTRVVILPQVAAIVPRESTKMKRDKMRVWIFQHHVAEFQIVRRTSVHLLEHQERQERQERQDNLVLQD
jgi:hypothetical protein